MSGRLFFFLTFIMLFTFAHSPALSQQSEPADPVFKPISLGSEEDKLAFDAMTKAFNRYTSLLQDVYESEGYLVSSNAKNAEGAITYLCSGFDYELASDIAQAYTQWIPDLNALVIIPCDGIPILTEADFNEICFYRQSQSNIIFQRSYNGCYFEEDCYIFSIALVQTPDGWRITQLNLEECSNLK